MLHTDIPTEAELRTIAATRSVYCISMYLPTGTLAADAESARIKLGNQLDEAVAQLEQVGADATDIDGVRNGITALIDDSFFWTYQSHSLAIFATPERLMTFRIPNRLSGGVHVADRFHLKPLLRAVSFPQAAFVLALSQNAVRMIEVTIEGSAEDVTIADLPRDASDIFATRGDKGSARLIGAEGEKTLLGHYARQISDAIRPTLNGLRVPLIIAAAEPLASIFRASSRYDGLVAEAIKGNAETMSANDLAAEARPILDRVYADEVAALTAQMVEAIGTGTGSADLSDLARAATYGAVSTLMVDIDRSISGFVDEQSGALTLSDTGDATDPDAGDAIDYGVVDEIARRALLSGARVVAVRADAMPDGAAAAGIMRFAV
jgi:hypothetical protein